METLIGYIVSPPFAKVGVFSLDTFYPQAERMTLAMNLNNILASPTFAAWTQGVPLDMQRILYTDQGLPQTAIFSIAHLSETERMFFVTMLLNQFIGWMRRQQGTSSLKAMLYMDEIFGYFPPTANPPSKKPMMLLLKQARAYGIGVVLSNQNPVDLDYKGLGNIGTWFVGRLQTRQDQEKVLEGIVGASEGNLDTALVKKILADMKGRQFLLKSAHLDEPLLFETRWAMSFLKGPMSTTDIKRLQGKVTAEAPAAAGDETSMAAQPPAATRTDSGISGHPPVLSPAIEQRYHLQNVVRDEVHFEPWLAGCASIRFYNAKKNLDIVRDIELRLYLDESFRRPEWSCAEEADFAVKDCALEPPGSGNYYSLPAEIAQLKDLRSLEKQFSDFLYQSSKLELFRTKNLDFESRPNESIGDFKVRLSDYLREEKEIAVEKLRLKYDAQQQRLEQKMSDALQRVEREKVDVQTKTADSLISFGVAVVGAFLGRKVLSASNISRAATGMRNVGRVAKERTDVKRAEDDVLLLQQEQETLAREIEAAVASLSAAYELDKYEIETIAIKPRRSDIFEVHLALLWDMVV
jgi:hypothetical protein